MTNNQRTIAQPYQSNLWCATGEANQFGDSDSWSARVNRLAIYGMLTSRATKHFHPQFTASMSLVGNRKAKWYDPLLSPILTWLYMPFVFGTIENGPKYDPVGRAIVAIGYLVRTPIYFLLLYSTLNLVFPDTNIHFLSFALVVGVITFLIEHVFNEYIRLDARLRYELGRLYIRQRAETIAQRLPKKADAIQKVVVVLILIWVVFFGLSGFIFFSR